jgi:hypothetical protein
MSRGVTPTFAARVDSPHVTHFPLVEMQLVGGTLYICGAPHDVTWNGNTYIAARGLGQIETIEESESEIKGLAFTLQGVTSDIIALALADQSQGRPVIVRHATLAGGTLEVDANVWTGLLDVPQIVTGAEPVVRYTAEHRLITWATPQPVRFSDADQQRLSPGDRFFEYAESTGNKILNWPAKVFFER